MDIPVSLVREHLKRRKPEASALGFGRFFSDHMFLMDYRAGRGWHDPRIVPYGPIDLDPAAAVLHYAQEIFENHKAFAGPPGQVALFRPRDYLKRLARSAERMCIPEIPVEVVLRGLKALLEIDREWVPTAPLTALNIRHSLVATEPFLGVRPSAEYLYFIITGPVGAYYQQGFAPVRILVENTYVRAVPGGVGAAKTGGNYAASLKAQAEAAALGFAQVLWLDGRERRYVEEVGAMNIFFKFRDELVTPPLTGTILPGITRDSVLTLARAMGLVVSERPLSIQEVVEGHKSGRLEEVFGTGTAAVVAPVASLTYKEEELIFGGGRTGELTETLFTQLTALQYGQTPDPHGWREVVLG